MLPTSLEVGSSPCGGSGDSQIIIIVPKQTRLQSVTLSQSASSHSHVQNGPKNRVGGHLLNAVNIR